MKQLTLLIIFFSAIGRITAQVNIRERINFKDTLVVDRYKPEANGFNHLKLKMSPGDFRIHNEEEVSKLRAQTIIAVDLVYSDYPVGEDFTELNRRRIIELFGILPEAFNNNMIEWRIVKQTGVERTGGIQSYFHGIVIYYRPLPAFEDERKYLEKVADGRETLTDSTILKTFARNKTWKDMLVVCDVTGSMSPYTGQLLLWIKANEKLKTVKHFVFFNDDDEKSTNQLAKEDKTGMWTVDRGNFKQIFDTLTTAMFEGEHYENNLEAVCTALKKYPDAKNNIVLIADNWENPCDMYLLEYLKKLKVPIRIIVCGVDQRFNTNYLDIVYATGGSVHTMEDDLQMTAKLGEGKTIKIGSYVFKMMNGKFVQIRETKISNLN